MTTVEYQPEQPGDSPYGARVTETELPISGCRAVLTRRGPRQTLEILDPHCRLLSVISDSLLDPAVLRGSWRGVRDGQPWVLVVGRSVSGPVNVTFSSRRSAFTGHSVGPIDVTPAQHGAFWLAEAVTAATRAAVMVAGLPAGAAVLQQVS